MCMATAGGIIKIYLALSALSTFASSLIWGINTLFLLAAELSVTQAFAANAFFTIGQVCFEVPTGVVADTLGRRFSYLCGAATLLVSTLLYLGLWWIKGPFWAWALVSVLLGLGFTFFSGATEAWLVDALHFVKFEGPLEVVFAKAQMAGGAAMLSGAVAGGAIAQATNLGVPYLLRCAMLLLTFVAAYFFMHDAGFSPRKDTSVVKAMRSIFHSSLEYGFGNPPVRWLMLAGPFTGGVGFYAFYAMQPYLLELYSKGESYAVAGLAAALVAGAQIAGGLSAPYVRRIFRLRTTLILSSIAVSASALALLGLTGSFGPAVVLLVIWALVSALSSPARQAYINGLIPSQQRATVLSSDNLLNSCGGVFIQPALGRAADLWGYSVSYVVGAAVELAALPFVLLARFEKASSDEIK